MNAAATGVTRDHKRSTATTIARAGTPPKRAARNTTRILTRLGEKRPPEKYTVKQIK
jgi:hypothetical protein